MSISKRFAYSVYAGLVALFLTAGAVMAGTEVGSFTAPLATSLGGTGLDTSSAANGKVLIGNGSGLTLATLTQGSGVTITNGSGTITIAATGASHALLDGSVDSDTAAGTVARGDLIVGNATPAWARKAVGTNGQFVGTDGTDTGWHTITGTANRVTVSASSGDLTFTGPQDLATSSNVTFGTVAAKLTYAAKTANYSVLSTDTNSFFSNSGASAEVDFTLPTAAAGLVYGFYIDAAQVLKIIAGSSTTIQVGGSVSTSAGNVSNNVVGATVWLVAISSTKWVAFGCMGSWTTA